MTWASFLLSMVGPLAKRALAALGVGVVSYVGVSAAVDAALVSAQTAFSGIVGEVAALLAMAGFFQALSISVGGLVSGIAFIALRRFGVLG